MAHPAPDDIYQHDVDFTSLALQYPAFAKKLKPNRQLDFTDPESVRQLTLSLLHRDFNLALTLPPSRLCPPVPNRFNYILHLQRLLDTTSASFRETFDPARQVIGLDIGTGASCIYPLLACRQREGWRMLATEIDETSRDVARDNIERNGLERRIRIVETDSTSRQIIPVKELEQFERIDFLMTNPPFYASQAQLLASAKSKSRPPNSSCTGAPIEMIYPYPAPNAPNAPNTPSNAGGEVSFLTQIIHESLSPRFSTKIQWFTGMLGHLSSLSTLISLLKSKGCDNYCVWEFVQGQKTRRWGIAWSWMGLRPNAGIARSVGGGLEKKLLPVVGEMDFEIVVGEGKEGLGALGERIDKVVSELVDEDEEDEEDEEEDGDGGGGGGGGGEGGKGMQWQWKSTQRVGVGMTWKGDCWSRKARRQRKHRHLQKHMNSNPNNNTETNGDVDAEMSDAPLHPNHSNHNTISDAPEQEHGTRKSHSNEPALVFKVSLSHRSAGDANKSTTKSEGITATTTTTTPIKGKVHVRWLQGHDPVLFESFCGWLKRKLSTTN